MKIYLLSVLVVLVAVTHTQWTGSAGLGVSNKGPTLNYKLSVGRPAEKWVNVGIKFKFKRSTHDVLPKYNILIQGNLCHFDVYDENGDGIITLKEMTSLFEDKELGANLFKDLHIFKENQGIRKSEFYQRIPLVVKGCAL